MTDEQMDDIRKRLDSIGEMVGAIFLAIMQEPPAPAEGCGHERAIDMSTMGMMPGQRMFCPDCNETFSRIEG